LAIDKAIRLIGAENKLYC